MSITDLPAVNASLNLISTIFISAGWYFIRRNFWQRHIACMIIAVVSSSAFLTCFIPVFSRRWDRHRRIAKWTMPIWLYVSVTGVLVYLMLYKWFPPANLALPG